MSPSDEEATSIYTSVFHTEGGVPWHFPPHASSPLRLFPLRVLKTLPYNFISFPTRNRPPTMIPYETLHMLKERKEIHVIQFPTPDSRELFSRMFMLIIVIIQDRT